MSDLTKYGREYKGQLIVPRMGRFDIYAKDFNNASGWHVTGAYGFSSEQAAKDWIDANEESS